MWFLAQNQLQGGPCRSSCGVGWNTSRICSPRGNPFIMVISPHLQLDPGPSWGQQLLRILWYERSRLANYQTLPVWPHKRALVHEQMAWDHEGLQSKVGHQNTELERIRLKKTMVKQLLFMQRFVVIQLKQLWKHGRFRLQVYKSVFKNINSYTQTAKKQEHVQ